MRLSKVSGVVAMGGRRRNNIIREMGDGVRVSVVRALASDAALWPAMQVRPAPRPPPLCGAPSPMLLRLHTMPAARALLDCATCLPLPLPLPLPTL